MSNGFFVSSIPKSGTHLVNSLIELWSGQTVISVKEKANYQEFDFSKYANCESLSGHYRASQVKSNESLRDLFLSRTVIVIIRDPRDLCNSMLHYLMKSQNPHHQAAARQLNGLNYEQQIIDIAIGIRADNGVAITPNLNKWCTGFVELLDEFKNATLLRYEDFFEIEKISYTISRLFSIEYDDARLLILNGLSSGSKTKRDGGARPDQWKSIYSRRLQKYFIDNYSETIEHLGYEV